MATSKNSLASFLANIIRERPATLLKVMQGHVENKHRLVISAITYAELRFGAIGKKASPKHNLIIDQFMARVDAVLPWDKAAVEATAIILHECRTFLLKIGQLKRHVNRRQCSPKLYWKISE